MYERDSSGSFAAAILVFVVLAFLLAAIVQISKQPVSPNRGDIRVSNYEIAKKYSPDSNFIIAPLYVNKEILKNPTAIKEQVENIKRRYR